MPPSTNVRDLFDYVRDSSEGFCANCPRCDDVKMKFSWNEEKNVGCCHHSGCQWSMDKGGVTLYRLQVWFKKTIIQYHTPKYKEREKTTATSTLLPSEYVILDELDKDLRESLYSYFESRDICRKALQTMKVGYCQTGKHWGYVIFPIFDLQGNPIYWQGRRFKNREPKFYNPKLSKKGKLFYQIGGNVHTKKIILVESIINALTLYNGYEMHNQVLMALLGKSLSEPQRDHILAHERFLKEVVIALDDDAWSDSVEMAKQIHGFEFAVKIAKIPGDINSYGRMNSWQAVNNAVSYNPEKHASSRSKEVKISGFNWI